jgi:hypothetical protein
MKTKISCFYTRTKLERGLDYIVDEGAPFYKIWNSITVHKATICHSTVGTEGSANLKPYGAYDEPFPSTAPVPENFFRVTTWRPALVFLRPSR